MSVQASPAARRPGGEDVPVIALDNLLDDGKISANGKYLISSMSKAWRLKPSRWHAAAAG